MVICFVTAPHVSVKYDAWAMFTTPVCEPVTPSTGETMSGVNPFGPEMVQVAGGLVTFHVNGTEVGVFLRTRVGLEEKVMMVGEVSVQVLFPELYVYPLFAVQLGYVPGQLAGQTGFSVQVLLNEL
jgi:hypothetical protein